MKNSGKIACMLLMLLIAGNLSLSAQRGMRGMRPDSAGMDRMRMDHFPGIGRMGQMGCGMRMMPPGMWRSPMRQGIQQTGMGMNRAPGFRQQGPGQRIMENIPNLTDKQKKDMADLRGKQQAEIEKLRIDMQSKMKELREAHRVKVISLLTDDQKKRVEENTPNPTGK